MKISIVTISFNQARYLKQCIESILGQADCELEYIVVDPGSTDGSREIIESYGDRIIRVFEKDAGPADGLNKGFSRATGEVFGFTNSDDYLLPDALRNVTQFFRENGFRQFVTGHGYIADPSGELKRARPSLLNLTNMLHCAGVVFQQATFFPANAFIEARGFNIKNDTCWDYELFVRFLRNGLEHSVIEADLAIFRLHEDSISGSGRLIERYFAELDRIFEESLGRKRSLKDETYTQVLRAKRVFARLMGRPN